MTPTNENFSPEKQDELIKSFIGAIRSHCNGLTPRETLINVLDAYVAKGWLNDNKVMTAIFDEIVEITPQYQTSFARFKQSSYTSSPLAIIAARLIENGMPLDDARREKARDIFIKEDMRHQVRRLDLN